MTGEAWEQRTYVCHCAGTRLDLMKKADRRTDVFSVSVESPLVDEGGSVR